MNQSWIVANPEVMFSLTVRVAVDQLVISGWTVIHPELRIEGS